METDTMQDIEADESLWRAWRLLLLIRLSGQLLCAGVFIGIGLAQQGVGLNPAIRLPLALIGIGCVIAFLAPAAEAFAWFKPALGHPDRHASNSQ